MCDDWYLKFVWTIFLQLLVAAPQPKGKRKRRRRRKRKRRRGRREKEEEEKEEEEVEEVEEEEEEEEDVLPKLSGALSWGSNAWFEKEAVWLCSIPLIIPAGGPYSCRSSCAQRVQVVRSVLDRQMRDRRLGTHTRVRARARAVADRYSKIDGRAHLTPSCACCLTNVCGRRPLLPVHPR